MVACPGHYSAHYTVRPAERQTGQANRSWAGLPQRHESAASPGEAASGL